MDRPDRDRPDPDRLLSERLLSERLAEFRPTPWTGEVWRHTLGTNPPDRRNTRGARWNPSGVEALYVSVDRATALAEGDYLIAAQPLRPIARRTIHRLQVSMAALVDLTEPGALERLGIDDEARSSDDHRACQSLGAAAALLGLDGLMVPSARSPGANIVILFGNPRTTPRIEVIDSEPLSADAGAGYAEAAT